MSKPGPDDIVLAYSVANLDRGEGMEYAVESIVRMTAKKPSVYFFVIVCRPWQILKARGMIVGIRNRILKLNPQLTNKEVFVGATTDNNNRPFEDELSKYFKQAEKTGAPVQIMDINPERPPR